MRYINLLILSLFVFNVFIASAQTQTQDSNVSWSQSYKSYRNDIKPLPKKEKMKCEQRLKEILKDLDTKNKCNSDDECTLLEQDPFGNTVPILKRDAEETKSKIKKYDESCIDPSMHGFVNKELVHIPTCWKNKCMVKTSLKKN